MTDEPTPLGPMVTRDDYEEALAEREEQEAKAAQDALQASEKERFLLEWKQAGGTEAEFNKEYPALLSEKRRGEVLDRDRAAQAQVDAHYKEAF